MKKCIIALLIVLMGCTEKDTDLEKQKVKFTISCTTGGKVDVESGYYTIGKTISINAIPYEGYSFTYWEGMESKSKNLEFVITKNTVLKACFKKIDNNIDKNNKLPYIEITTSENIVNEPKTPAYMKIYENGELSFEHRIGIEYRGSTSYTASDKKSFGLETWDNENEDKSVSIFGFPKESDWILMGHVFKAKHNRIYDPTLIRHFIGYQLFRDMGNYASRCKFVELAINGNFMGTYIFMEKLKRDKNRINIEKLKPSQNNSEEISGGYILKIDKTSGDVLNSHTSYTSNICFRSDFGITGEKLDFIPFGHSNHPLMYKETYFLYEYPKAKNISIDQKKYIQNYIRDFETALLTDDLNSEKITYLNYIDINSFVDYFILNELTGNIDAYRISTYLYKDRNKKLCIGPVWDLNIGYNGQNRVPHNDWIANYNDYVKNDPWMVPFWWDKFLVDEIFTNALKKRWTQLRSTVLTNTKIINLVENTSQLLIKSGAIKRNYEKWKGIYVDYDSEIKMLKQYLQNRLSWMDKEIKNM
jgi:spore coat protein CotH